MESTQRIKEYEQMHQTAQTKQLLQQMPHGHQQQRQADGSYILQQHCPGHEVDSASLPPAAGLPVDRPPAAAPSLHNSSKGQSDVPPVCNAAQSDSPPPPPLPAGPIPLTTILPVSAVRVGHLPHLFSEGSVPQTADLQSRLSQRMPTVTVCALSASAAGGAAADVDAVGTTNNRLSTDAGTAAAARGGSMRQHQQQQQQESSDHANQSGDTRQRPSSNPTYLAYAGSLNCWLESNSSLQQQQQQWTRLQPSSQQQRQLAARAEDSQQSADIQQQSPFSKLLAVLQQHRQSLGQLFVRWNQELWQLEVAQRQSPAAAPSAAAVELLPARFEPVLRLLSVMLGQLVPGAATHELLHIEALLLLLLLPAADGLGHNDSSPEGAARAGDPVNAGVCKDRFSRLLRTEEAAAGQEATAAAAAAAESMQQLAAALDIAFSAAMEVHAAAAAGHDPTEVVVRFQEYIHENQQLLQEVFAEFDSDGDGRLNPHEMSGFITVIPQLQRHEQGLLLAVAAQYADSDGAGCLGLQELLGVTEAFTKHQKLLQRLQPQQHFD